MLRLAAPASDLDGVVESGIVVRRAAVSSVTRFPAMPRAMLTWSPGTDGQATATFHALSTRPVAHVHERPFEALGLVLPADTAARLLGPSVGALVDAALPWAEVAGATEAARLGDALARARTDGAGLRALQDSVRRVLARGSERVHGARTAALRQLCAAVGAQGVRAATSLGLGERHLERRCHALLGLSPKQLQRLTRAHAVLADAVRHHRVPGADDALAAGYYDQSHLARELRQLAGAPLRELLRGAHADGAWWPLATQRLAPRGAAAAARR